MRNHHAINISAVIFREGEHWITQCLEYDICVQAKSLEEVHGNFARAIIENAVVCVELGKEPFETIDAAPKKFWDMFSEAKLKIEADLAPIRVPHPSALPGFVPNYRVIDRRAA